MITFYKNFADKASSFRKSKEGSLLTIAAIALPVLVLAAGGATDYNRINDAQSLLANAVDAAVQNEATMLEKHADPELEGNKFFAANFPENYMGAELIPGTNGKGPLNLSHGKVGKELRVTGSAAANLPLTFAGALGIDSYRIEHTATVARVVKENVEIVLAIDVSPSMCALSVDSANEVGLSADAAAVVQDPAQDPAAAKDPAAMDPAAPKDPAAGPAMMDPAAPGDPVKDPAVGDGIAAANTRDVADLTVAALADSKAAAADATAAPNGAALQSPVNFVPDPNCTKLELLKLAMKKFVEHVFDNSAINVLKVGIVPYNHKIKFADPNSIPPTIAAGEVATPDYYTDLSDASPLPDVVPLTTDENVLLDAIDGIHLDLDAQGWTRTNLGMHAAATMLDPANTQYFGGETPKSFDDSSVEKIIVHMTDGANMGCCWVEPGQGYNPDTYSYLYKTDMDDQAQLCEVLKSSTADGGGNITIFPVVFDVRDTDYPDQTSENISGIEREGGKWIKQVFKACASNPQFYFDVPVTGTNNVLTPESEIEKAYFAIASYLYKLRFVY